MIRPAGSASVVASGSSAAVAPDPAPPCAAASCSAGAVHELSDGYSVRLWSSVQPTTADTQALSSTPVVELLRSGAHVSWWTGRLGYGWSATLDCLPTAGESNCVVLSALGAHAGSAEVLLLRSGALVSPARASVVFDSGSPVAADFDGDGLLDIAGIENDYQPDYASGHNFWTTYRLAGDGLTQTGCVSAAADSPAPTALLTGRCPVVPQG